MTKTEIFQSENIRVTGYDLHHQRLVISFDHWRRDRNGFPAQQPSQFFAKNNTANLTIHSARNDWFLSPDLPALQKTLSKFTKSYTRITAIGFSMGGYAALLMARAIRVNQVVLVSPQSSIFPERAAFETRYQGEAAQLDPALDTLPINPRKGLHGALLFDPQDKIDTQHMAIITGLFPKIAPVPLTFGGHPAMQVITQANKYRKVQEELLRDRIRPSAFLHLHKSARSGSAIYQRKLKAYLDQRRARVV